jgi:hypothetical protein
MDEQSVVAEKNKNIRLVRHIDQKCGNERITVGFGHALLASMV